MVQTLTARLIEQGFSHRPINERQMARIAGGGAAQRYGLVNRALKAQELIQVRRGLYVLPPKFRTEPLHPFVVAQALEPGSYVSLETALSLHGWTPEGVPVTASIVPGRKSSTLEHPTLGTFTFHPLALHKERFLELIERRQFGSQTAWVAKPARALMDLVALRKVEWQGLEWITEGLRIEEEILRGISRAQIQTLTKVYKQKRPLAFLEQLNLELAP